MPNHVHVLIETFDGHPIRNIVHSWKSFTAKEANKLLGRTGAFWMEDYHDRFIRNEEHFQRALAYIRNNPVKAGLVQSADQWPFTGNAGVPPAPERAGRPRSQ